MSCLPLKLIGGVLLSLAGFGAGSLFVRRLDKRRRFFASFLTFLSLLATRLRYRSDDIFNAVNACLQETGLTSLSVSAGLPFDAAWSDAVASLRLSREDADLLKEFGSQLGKTDVEGQLGHLSLFESVAQKRLRECEEELEQKSRVCRAVGLFVGVCAALLLI